MGNLVQNNHEIKYIRLNPKIIIFNALGGFTAGAESQSAAVVVNLREFMIKHKLAMVIDTNGDLIFTPIEKTKF